MKTAPMRTPVRLLTHYPGGYAWPAGDDRFGRYVMCPIGDNKPMGLGVVDDFGDLVHVPSVGISVAQPLTGVLA